MREFVSINISVSSIPVSNIPDSNIPNNNIPNNNIPVSSIPDSFYAMIGSTAAANLSFSACASARSLPSVV